MDDSEIRVLVLSGECEDQRFEALPANSSESLSTLPCHHPHCSRARH